MAGPVQLTLIPGGNNTITDTATSEPGTAPTLTPVTDPIREAAHRAAYDPDTVIDKYDAIDRAAERLAAGHRPADVLRELADTLFLNGFYAACAGQIEAGIADALAELGGQRA